MNNNFPLVVGNLYSKYDLSEILSEDNLKTVREGVYRSKNYNSILFFVDLEKIGKEERFHFNNFFEGDIFHCDTQTTQHVNSPTVQKIINKEVEVQLFVRLVPRIKSKVQPFVYCGRLEYLEHDVNTTKPVHILYNSLDYDENTSNQLLLDIYDWKPEKIGKTTSYNNYQTTNNRYKSNGEQKKPNYTERKGLVSSRVGQGWYRQEILKKWNNKCPITGCDIKEILISSHIKHWSQCNDDERLDVDNGILLSPNIDSLFDRHLISFTDEGRFLIGETISNETLKSLGINTSIQLTINEGMKKYLKVHRENFFIKK